MEWYWKACPKGHEEWGYLKAVTGPRAVGSHNVLKKYGFTWRCDFQHELERYEEEDEEEGDEGMKYVMLTFGRLRGHIEGRTF